jgi:hypothetical protein
MNDRQQQQEQAATGAGSARSLHYCEPQTMQQVQRLAVQQRLPGCLVYSIRSPRMPVEADADMIAYIVLNM